MKKLFTLAAILSLSYGAQAQVGIGTTDPKANLDVREANPAAPTAYAGIAIPRVSVLPASGNVGGQIVYHSGVNLYYFYNGSSWRSLSTQTNTLGDVKYGFQTSDHNGWIKLDGRPKGNLTTTQQAAASALGIGTSLPDASNKFLISNNNGSEAAIGSTIGSNTASVTIAQQNLPNINMTGSTTSDGGHSHTYNIKASNSFWPVDHGADQNINLYYNATSSTSTDGAHSHTVTVNTGGSGTAIPVSVVPSSIVTNTFIYLGN